MAYSKHYRNRLDLDGSWTIVVECPNVREQPRTNAPIRKIRKIRNWRGNVLPAHVNAKFATKTIYILLNLRI